MQYNTKDKNRDGTHKGKFERKSTINNKNKIKISQNQRKTKKKRYLSEKNRGGVKDHNVGFLSYSVERVKGASRNIKKNKNNTRYISGGFKENIVVKYADNPLLKQYNNGKILSNVIEVQNLIKTNIPERIGMIDELLAKIVKGRTDGPIEAKGYHFFIDNKPATFSS